DKHSRLDEPLDDDQPDDRVRLGGDRTKLVPEPGEPWSTPPISPGGYASSRSRKRMTRHAAFFRTYGAVLPRLNSPNRRLYGRPMTITSACHSSASPTMAGPVSRD